MSFASFYNSYASDRRGIPRAISGTMGGGLFDDVLDFGWDNIAGLAEALGHALEKTMQAIGKVGETIALIVRAIIGDVSWNEVLNELGSIFQDVGAIIVYLNPAVSSYEWLSTSRLSAHAFAELDKFTGGMITTATNVSSLVGRAMRGDPISKQELIADIVFIIQVVLIVFTGGAWVAIGVMLGTMVGREVCKHQTEARDACLVAFQILGAAAGAWGQALYSSGFSAAEQEAWLGGDETYAKYLEDQAKQGFSAAEENAWLNGKEAYANYVQSEARAGSTSFLSQLSRASEAYLNRVGIDQATQQAVRACQSGHWVGNNECAILGHVASDYLKSPANTSWPEFLGQEIVKVGAEQLMLQWFPPDSPEYRAIQDAWNIRYVTVPVDQTILVQKHLDPKTFLLLAGGIAFALIGAS